MPTKVEIFQNTEPSELQKMINNWLAGQSNIHVEHVTQSQVQHGQSGPMPITVCIWYGGKRYA